MRTSSLPRFSLYGDRYLGLAKALVLACVFGLLGGAAAASCTTEAVQRCAIAAGARLAMLLDPAQSPDRAVQPHGLDGEAIVIATKPETRTQTASAQINMPPTKSGQKLTILSVIEIAYESGFRREDTLLAAVAMAVAESGLWSAARNWKPELGYRPATDRIGVAGPPMVWSDGRQIHSDRGIWQISSFWWPKVNDSTADDPRSAARTLYRLSRGGANFMLWDSFRSGRALKHYDSARDGWPPLRPFIQDFLANGRTIGSAQVGPGSG